MQSLLMLSALIGIAYSQHVDFSPYSNTALLIFVSSDLNHDGVFSRIEFDHLFAKYDANGDGRVSRHEYTHYITIVTPPLHDFSHVLYDDLDVDGDHHLDKHDFDVYYAKLDADSDGSVTETEFINYWVALFIKTEHLHGHGHGHGGHEHSHG